MNKGGAPEGNKNAANAKAFTQSLKRVMAHSDGSATKGMEKVAKKLYEAACEGEQWAIKEFADRIEGKPAQTIAGDPDAPLKHEHTVTEVLLRALKNDQGNR